MDPILERLKLKESTRQELRPLLIGITPFMLVDRDPKISIAELMQLGVCKVMAFGLTAASIGYVKSNKHFFLPLF